MRLYNYDEESKIPMRGIDAACLGNRRLYWDVSTLNLRNRASVAGGRYLTARKRKTNCADEDVIVDISSIRMVSDSGSSRRSSSSCHFHNSDKDSDSRSTGSSQGTGTGSVALIDRRMSNFV